MSDKHQDYYSPRAISDFLEETFEIAFGDGAIYKNYSMKDVVEVLKANSGDALKHEYTEQGHEQ